MSAFTAATALPLHNPFKCNATPPDFAFDAATASGTWYMHESTEYNKEKFGCLQLEISSNVDTAAKKFDARFSYMKTFDWNLFDTGKPYIDRYTYTYTDTGKLSRKDMLVINNTHQVMFADTTTTGQEYIVMYDCSFYMPHVLNMVEDQVHIYTKSGTYDATMMATVKALITTAHVEQETIDRFNRLETTACRAKTVWSQVSAVFSEPEQYFSNW